MVFRLATSDPFTYLRSQFDRLLGGIETDVSRPDWFDNATLNPPLNAWIIDENLVVEMELPGVTRENIDISVRGDELFIAVDYDASRPEETGKYLRRERPTGSRARSLRLPFEVDVDAISAKLTDGILTVALPKSERAKPKRIEVTSD